MRPSKKLLSWGKAKTFQLVLTFTTLFKNSFVEKDKWKYCDSVHLRKKLKKCQNIKDLEK